MTPSRHGNYQKIHDFSVPVEIVTSHVDFHLTKLVLWARLVLMEGETETMTETVTAQCLACQYVGEREVPLDEGSDTQTAADVCPRCHGYDVRTIADAE